MTAEMDGLRKATKKFLRLSARTEEARKEVFDAAITALRAGERPTDVADESPYTAAYLRRVARDHGIAPSTPGRKAPREEPMG
ncbi:hypothetical protein ACFXG4_04145 [Nocardia sp. NPDC059246]|uniref:hypothetical protein n=1 Tax=unclassified Nocardia TaxID=2637762 RepID=UPI00368EED92